jgi:putative ABC transport system substrate-binding protein
MTSISTDLNGKRLALVKEVVPRVSRVAILWDMANPGSELAMRDVEVSAPSLGVALQNLGVRRPDALESAFTAMTREHAGAVVLIPSPRFFPERRRLSELSLKDRLPMVAGSSEYAEAGGLMSYGTHYPDLFRHAAEYVDRILKGAKPADLPIQQPTKFELVINLKTAKALGLTIPPSLLQRADQVIE